MLRIFIIIIISGLSLQGMAQASVQEVLTEIEKNNPKLKAHQKYLEAQKLGIRSQNNLNDPELEWVKSFSSQEGKPYEILLSQKFDFPSSYIYKNQLKNKKIENLKNSREKTRQEVLLASELSCFELIYRNKQKKELSKRLKNAEQLRLFFEKKLEKGDGTILELNKIRMLALNTKNQLQLVASKISNLQQDLKKQNGGIDLNFQFENYPVLAVNKDENTHISNAIKADPYLKQLSSIEQMSTKKIALSKTASLPSITIGYRYLNSDFMKEANGIKLGVSIPLWANKNKIRQAKQMKEFHTEEFSFQKLEKESEYKQLYQTFSNLTASLENYEKIFSEKKYDHLLRKALDFGEISGIEYLTESIYYYDSFDTFLEIEFEYFNTKAKLLRYLL